MDSNLIRREAIPVYYIWDLGVSEIMVVTVWKTMLSYGLDTKYSNFQHKNLLYSRCGMCKTLAITYLHNIELFSIHSNLFQPYGRLLRVILRLWAYWLDEEGILVNGTIMATQPCIWRLQKVNKFHILNLEFIRNTKKSATPKQTSNMYLTNPT